MALLDSEVARIKAELGYNVLTVGAEPYIGVSRLFEIAIQPYTSSGASTTSVTTVASVSTPTAVTLTLASGTGFASGVAVIVDVDSLAERATARNVSGTALSVILSKAHSGTYPVIVEGGESIIRELLWKLRDLTAPGGLIETIAARAGIIEVDEIKFAVNSQTGRTTGLSGILEVQEYLRDELASVLNVQRFNSRRGGGAVSAVY